MSFETMTSRERVIAAINHKIPDRMPIDLGMHNSTGISAFAYWNLREFLGLSNENTTIVDVTQFLARVDEDILKRFHCDCIMLQPKWPKVKKWNIRDKYNFNIPSTANPVLEADGSWTISRSNQTMRMPKDGFFFDGGWPQFNELEGEEYFKSIISEAERIYNETDYFTTFIGYHAYFFCDDMEYQCNMITDPERVIEINDEIHRNQMKSLETLVERLGDRVQAVALNSDLGSQRGPLVNPELYKELCAPYVKEFCDFVHKNTDWKVFLHACGSIKALIPTLIESGIDIINPVQISAENMDPFEIKNTFGKDIVFWGGGCDTQNILGNGSTDAVRKNVQELISVFKPHGGFVFNQVHNIMGNVPPENIVTMLDTAYEESFYEGDNK